MAQIYLSAVDYIKNKPFDVWVPAFYHPHIPQEMVHKNAAPLGRTNPYRWTDLNRRNMTPFYQPHDASQMQRASYPIEIMLDMFQKKIEFELGSEDDVPEIFDALDRYLLSLKDNVADGNEAVIEYARLVLRWRAEMYKHYFRYMQTHPAALANLHPNNNKEQSLVRRISVI